MHTTHTTLHLSHHTLHRVDFDPATFTPADLFWLPHHAQLQSAGRKRQCEHLAGRLAAFYALQDIHIRAIPGIDASRAPRWPAGVYGSISHSHSTALAVIARHPVGIDIEPLFTAEICAELTTSIVTEAERVVLERCGLPFPLALTLAFSAKESLYKAFATTALPGFFSAQVTALNASHVTLTIGARFSPARAGETVAVAWCSVDDRVVTLVAGS